MSNKYAYRVGNAFVLGGNGFVGKALINELKKENVSICAVSRKNKTEENDGVITWVVGDLLDPNLDLSEHLKGCTVIFNCAGELYDESRMQSLHVEATKRILNMCRACKSKLHWVQLSSVGAYGQSIKASASRDIIETSALHPLGSYEVTKSRADEIIISAGKSGYITYTILRPSIIFGPGMPNSSLRNFIEFIRRGYFFYIGKSSAILPYIHIDDVVRALYLCGYNLKAENQVFNISNDVLLDDFVLAISSHYGVSPQKIRVPEVVARFFSFLFSRLPGFPLKKTRIDALVAKTSYPNKKIYDFLGLKPQKNLTFFFLDVFSDAGNKA